MTDRELLELAAKAAGIEVHESDDGTMQRRPVLAMTHYVQGQPYSETRWDPLRDDAQALRLAVKLGMTISLIPPYENDSYCSVVADWSDETGYPRTSIRIKHAGDPLAATRRAIVRAAAETAKQEVKT